MRLPRKIDDRLKDAIVSLQFVPAVPPETVIGYAHSLLKEHFDPIETGLFPTLSFNEDGVTLNNKPLYFLSRNKEFRIDIDGQSLTFNLAQGYAGWALYREVITNCLGALFKSNIIRSVSRLGIRYISQLPNLRISDAIDIRLTIPLVPEERRGQLRLEFNHRGAYTILTLVDGYPTDTRQPNKLDSSFFSLIDVDIIKYYSAEQSIDLESLLSHIEAAHNEQKVLFFSLLKDEFLDSLNPKY